jgi:acyl-CoA synthetase (AMP-forming)/AMP-acid ligase II
MIMRSPYPEVAIPPVPVASFVLRHAKRLDNKPALIDGATGHMLTYGQLAEATQRVAAGLAARGLRRGEVLALALPNSPEFAIPFLAAAHLGAITTPINPLLTTEELANQLIHARARTLVTTTALLERVQAVRQHTGLQEVFVLDPPLDLAQVPMDGPTDGPTPSARRGWWGWLRPTGHAEPSRSPSPRAATTPFAALLQGGASVRPAAIDVQQDVAVLPFSSGTTGLAKGVMLTHHNLVANLCQLSSTGLVREQDIVIGVLPFFHIYGFTSILALSLTNGATVVTLPRFDLAQFLQVLQRHRVTVGFLVPPIALALARHPMVSQYDLSALRRLISGAAPLSKEVQTACAARLRCLFLQGWGMTETSPVLTLEPLDAALVKPGAAGVVLPNSACKVLDLLVGRELGPNTLGEICAWGPQVMKGYLNQSEATAQILEPDGWLHTGDIGYFDADGHLYVVDRLKELIKFKGYQVAPAELEALLLAHPTVADAAVIPVADEEAGEVPKAFVVRQPGAGTTEGELMAYVAANVAPYKRVRQVEFIEEIPKSASGKILRRVLVERERAAGRVASSQGVRRVR